MTRYFGHPDPSDYVGLINAADTSAYNYVIGPISSSNKGATWTAGSGAVISPSGAGWRSVYVKDPCLLWDGSQWVVYICGFNGSNFQIGRLTAPDWTAALAGTWTEYGSNPIIGVPADGSYRHSGGTFPWVIYNPDDTPKWRMWIGGSNAGVFTVGYLSSSDGLTWTDHGRVLNVGTAGAQDDTWCHAPTAFKLGSTWHVYYAGYRTATGFMKAMHATCTDPSNAATYTKTGVLTGFSSTITLGGLAYRSNYIRQVMRQGSSFRVFGSAFNASGQTKEGAFTTTATDPTTITVPSGLLVAYSGWTANSAENSSVVAAR